MHCYTFLSATSSIKASRQQVLFDHHPRSSSSSIMKRGNEKGQLSKEEYEREEEGEGEGGGSGTFQKADDTILKQRKIIRASRRYGET